VSAYICKEWKQVALANLQQGVLNGAMITAYRSNKEPNGLNRKPVGLYFMDIMFDI
jgi:hypothetical protein